MGLSLRGWSVEQVLDGGLFCLGLIQAHLITVLRLIFDSYTSRSTRFVSLIQCVGYSIFNFVLFLLKFIFLFNKMHGLFGL